MIRKRNKYLLSVVNTHKIRKKDKIFAFLFCIVVILFLYIRYLALPIVINNTDSQLRSYATKSINYAVADTMNQNVSYGDLINIVK